MTAARTLEEGCSLDVLWNLFLIAAPPPVGMPQEVVESYRWFFASGLGTAVLLLRRLETESPERRATILAQIEKQCVEVMGMKLNG
jgi:hypothetical protein